ncbi:MAG: DoxX family protein [Solirubrobacterales bacterium]|nr:DoxX family protein [Solirubrobacterales bacterium]
MEDVARYLLAAIFAVAGIAKLALRREQLVGQMSWVAHTSDAQVKGIGALEVAAAAGLVLPEALDIAEPLTGAAAIGVMALMVGAAVTHVRIGEAERLPINVVLFALAAYVAAGSL